MGVHGTFFRCLAVLLSYIEHLKFYERRLQDSGFVKKKSVIYKITFRKKNAILRRKILNFCLKCFLKNKRAKTNYFVGKTEIVGILKPAFYVSSRRFFFAENNIKFEINQLFFGYVMYNSTIIYYRSNNVPKLESKIVFISLNIINM